MAIDDRIDAVVKQIEAEERERSPVTEQLANLAEELELIPGAGKIRNFLERHRERNRELLIRVLKEELQGVIKRLDQLDPRHQDFLRNEFYGLVADGLKRAEDARTRDHIRHLAAILANAAKVGPQFSTDDTADLMRIVIQLSEFDLKVLLHLRQMRPDTNGYAGGNPAPIIEDFNIFAALGGAAVGTRNEMVQSASLKLQSMGLVALDIANTPMTGILNFRILKKGVDMLEMIASA